MPATLGILPPHPSLPVSCRSPSPRPWSARPFLWRHHRADGMALVPLNFRSNIFEISMHPRSGWHIWNFWDMFIHLHVWSTTWNNFARFSRASFGHFKPCSLWVMSNHSEQFFPHTIWHYGPRASNFWIRGRRQGAEPFNRASRPCRPAKPPAEGRSFSYTAAAPYRRPMRSPVICGVFCSSTKTYI